MAYYMIAGAAILLLCIGFSKLLYRFGVPSLLIFIVLGMLAGSDGIGGIYFDDYALAQTLSSVALTFIMFFGGFSTNWKAAKPVAAPAILLSSVGTTLTALLTGLFCRFVLQFPLLESLLLGSIVASTDAASVFSILRSRKLNLKGGMASLLEIESGSNDPVSYMMTIIILTIMSVSSDIDPFAFMLTIILLTMMSGKGDNHFALLLFQQLGFGLLIGGLLGVGAVYFLRHVRFEVEAFYSLFVTAVAILCYALCDVIGGNSFLCVYIAGILLGNSKIPYKRSLVHFFDGISWLMQILLFFALGLLSFPSRLPAVAWQSIFISLFMIFVARPAAVFAILSWFKIPVRQQILVSWVGIRGAASIVFAIYAVTDRAMLQTDVFHIVFFLVLFSVLVQGTLMPTVAKKLDLVEKETSILRTFNDYQEKNDMELSEMRLTQEHPWCGCALSDIDLPESVLVVLIQRNKKSLVPRGSTSLKAGDILVLSGADQETLRAILPAESSTIK